MEVREAEGVFRRQIIKDFGPVDKEPNGEAEALFRAIQYSFGSLEGPVMVTGALLHHLAACAWVALEHDAAEAIPWEERDYILKRTWKALLQTILENLKADTLKIKDGKYYLGHLQIPNDLIETYKGTWAYQNRGT